MICGENANPLSRHALMAQGEQVHIASCPPIWPTRPPSEEGAHNLKRGHREIRAGAHAFEAEVFNIVASGFVDAAKREALGTANRPSLDIGFPQRRGHGALPPAVRQLARHSQFSSPDLMHAVECGCRVASR
jgi:nitrilase